MKTSNAYQDAHEIKVDLAPKYPAQVDGTLGYNTSPFAQMETVFVPVSVPVDSTMRGDIIVAAFELANALQVPIRLVPHDTD